MKPINPITAFALLSEIKSIDQLAHLRLQRALPQGLEVSHFSVLNHFSRLGGEKSPAQLARTFQVTKGAMTNTIARLESAGLVAVRADAADGRRKLVSLTEEGAQTCEDAALRVAPIFQEIAEAIGDEKLSEALPTLRKLRIFLSEA